MRTELARRIFSGTVQSDGSPSRGQVGWICRKLAVGQYQIIITEPNVILRSFNATNSNGNAVMCAITGIQPNSFNVLIFNTAGAAADQHFSFTAEALR